MSFLRIRTPRERRDTERWLPWVVIVIVIAFVVAVLLARPSSGQDTNIGEVYLSANIPGGKITHIPQFKITANDNFIASREIVAVRVFRTGDEPAELFPPTRRSDSWYEPFFVIGAKAGEGYRFKVLYAPAGSPERGTESLSVAYVEPTRNEAYYVEQFAAKYNAEVEVVMPDGTRCDLLSETHAIEVDWAHKHYEAVGQAIHYHLQTGKKPGVLLLAKDASKEWRHLVRCARVCGHLGVDLWIEEVR